MYEADHLDTKREVADTIRSTAVKRENRLPAYTTYADERFYGSRGSEYPVRYQPPGYLQENHASIPKQTAPGIRQDIVQRVLLIRNGSTYTERSDGRNNGTDQVNTTEKNTYELLPIMGSIKEPTLIQKIGDELLNKFVSLNTEKKIEEIQCFLDSLSNLEPEEKTFIICNLSDSFCHWLFGFIKLISERPEIPEISRTVNELFKKRRPNPALLENQLYTQVGQDKQPISNRIVPWQESTSWHTPEAISLLPRSVYDRLDLQMSGLAMLLPQIKGIAGSERSESYSQLVQLVAWKIIGYQRLIWRYENDDQMQRLQKSLEDLINIFKRETNRDVRDFLPKSESAEESQLEEKLQEQSRTTFPNYEMEDMHLVGLPTKQNLPQAISETDFMAKKNNIVEVAQYILGGLQRPGSKEKLVLYRGMSAPEAIEILKIFNTAKQSEVEELLIKGNDVTHDPAKYIAPIGWKKKDGTSKGGHLGERFQAEQYDTGEVNVTLAFILKAGARKLLFSKTLLTGRENVIQHSGFGKGEQGQGWNPDGIGINEEDNGVRYSVAVAASSKSKLILQLFVDRVQIVSIRFKEKLIYTEWS